MTRSSMFLSGMLFAFLMVVEAVCGFFSLAQADITINVTLSVNKGVGVGFGQLSEQQQELTVELNAPDEYDIQSSKPRDNNGEHLWTPQNGNQNKGKTHTYKVAGIVPEDGHAVGFEGVLTTAGEDGDPPVFDVAVADLDIDLPDVADDQEAVEPFGGLWIAKLHQSSGVFNPFPEQSPPNSRNLTVKLRPKWKGTPQNPTKIGDLTFNLDGEGLGLHLAVAIYKPDGTRLDLGEGEKIPIPPGDYNQTFKILTNNNFGNSVTIEAIFEWDESLSQDVEFRTASDKVRLTYVNAALDPVVAGIGLTHLNALNSLYNPAAIVIESEPTETNVAVFKITTLSPAMLPLEEDDERLQWEIRSEGGTAAFFQVNGNEDKTGTRVRVYGIAEGDVVLEARFSPVLPGDPPTVAVRARIVRNRNIPFRVNFLHGQTGGSNVTLNRAQQLIITSNIYLRQVGITLVPDTDQTEKKLGDETITRIENGYFKIEDLDDKYVKEVDNTDGPESSTFNFRNGVVNFNLIVSRDNNVRGTCFRKVVNVFTSDDSDPGDPTGKFITGLDEPSHIQRIQLDIAPTPPMYEATIIGLIITDLGAGGAFDAAAGTLAHELLHGLALAHRGESQNGPVYVDELQPDTRNLMTAENPGDESRQDIDLMQLRVVFGSQLMYSNSDGIVVTPEAESIELAENNTRENFKFTVTKDGQPVNNAKVEFIVQEGPLQQDINKLDLTSNSVVTTAANGEAAVSFKAKTAFGSASVWAMVTSGNNRAFAKVDVELGL